MNGLQPFRASKNALLQIKLSQAFKTFKSGAESGVTRLLTAFYFKQTGFEESGDRAFEFTHKSFGEYLVARRFVRFVSKVCDNYKTNQEDGESGLG